MNPKETTQSQPAEPVALYPMLDLENAVAKAMALIESQGERLSKLREEDRDDKTAGIISMGIIEMSIDTARQLNTAFDNAHAAYVAKSNQRPAQTPVTEQLARVLELTSDQARALALIGEWEGKAVVDYARGVLLALMFSSFEDMEQAAKAGRTAAERAWAKRFYPQVAALMPKKGWQS